MSLQYDDTGRVHCQLTLTSGRSVFLERLDQELAYAGLLEGFPSESINNMRIRSAISSASQRCVSGAKPYLITPPRRDYLREPGDGKQITQAFPRIIPEWLPEVRCIGVFKSKVIERGSVADMSSLVVVWYQDDFALPIHESVLEQLHRLDWDTLATDFEYL